MPRYFFDLQSGHDDQDSSGVECADLGAARRAAILALAQIAEDEFPSHGDDQHLSLTVRDSERRALMVLELVFRAGDGDGMVRNLPVQR